MKTSDESMPVEHFKSAESYRKWRAYRHIHGIKSRASHVVVGRRKHKVKHSKTKVSKR